jgi:hydroxyethylthiazole kinase
MDETMKTMMDGVRERKPLIHCITNYVTVNDVANALLASGASPVMSDDEGEVEEITAISAGLDVNIGTLNSRTVISMLKAGKKAAAMGHPVLLDPVGAGASRMRTDAAMKLLREVRFTAVRGNVSEIKTLSAGSGTTRGVDADAADAVKQDDLASAAGSVKGLAARLGLIVAVTGAVDLVSDGERCFAVFNGRPEMSGITGTGCQLSALMTAFLAANPERKLEAAAASLCAMGLAGEIAWGRMQPGDGNSTYRNRIIDAISNMTGETLGAGARYREM